jgi:hypothetical protein
MTVICVWVIVLLCNCAGFCRFSCLCYTRLVGFLCGRVGVMFSVGVIDGACVGVCVDVWVGVCVGWC